MKRLALLLACLMSPLGAQTRLPPAPMANTQLRDPAQEAAARTLMAELRCLVCQGQAIIDSDADMAGDMRALVRQRIARGESPAKVRAWLIERYGSYVTYNPPLSAVTAPLWIAPLLLLVLGGWLARGSFKAATGALMGWLALAVLGSVAAVLLWRIGIARQLWAFAGSALMLGAAGYALQGHPLLPGQPVVPNARTIAVDPGLVALREAMLGRYSADSAYLTAADAMMRSGNSGTAVRVVLNGIGRYPQSLVLWTGLGTTLATHDGGQVSPAALFAFRRAARLAPLHPAPPFFLGLAYVRAGEFAAARPYWARAVALTPPRLSYRRDLALRLALLDRYLAETAGTAP